MRARVRDQVEARRLRSEGASLRQIARAVDASVGSVSVWVRGCQSSKTSPNCRPRSLSRPSRKGRDAVAGAIGTFRGAHSIGIRPAINGGAGNASARTFRQRGALHRRQAEVSRRTRKAAAKKFIREHLHMHPYVDCGERDPVVLEFDHVGSKTGNVLTLARNGVSLERLKQEIDHCEVRCGDCHRRRTADRRRSAA